MGHMWLLPETVEQSTISTSNICPFKETTTAPISLFPSTFIWIHNTQDRWQKKKRMATWQSCYTIYYDNVLNQCWGNLPFCQRRLSVCSIHPAALEVHLSAARRILPGLKYCLKAAAHHVENWRKVSRAGKTGGGGGCKIKVRGVNRVTLRTDVSLMEISPHQSQLHNMFRHFESFIIELFPPQKKVVPVSCVVFYLPGTSCQSRALLFGWALRYVVWLT